MHLICLVFAGYIIYGEPRSFYKTYYNAMQLTGYLIVMPLKKIILVGIKQEKALHIVA